jgi:hypothetical protein
VLYARFFGRGVGIHASSSYRWDSGKGLSLAGSDSAYSGTDRPRHWTYFFGDSTLIRGMLALIGRVGALLVAAAIAYVLIWTIRLIRKDKPPIFPFPTFILDWSNL